VRSDLEELWDVEDDGEEDDEALVVLDVLLRKDGRVAELTVKTDPDISLKTEKKIKKFSYWCYLWNENSSEQNVFIQW